MDITPAPAQHRGSGWTLWREIYGTFIGVLPLILAVCVGALTLIRENDRHGFEIDVLKEQMKALKSESTVQRIELLARLDRISSQIEELQKQVARAGATSAR